MLILSVLFAFKESQIAKLNEKEQHHYNKGAFGAGAFFGFLVLILYFIDAFLQLIKIINEGFRARVPSEKPLNGANPFKELIISLKNIYKDF